MPPTAARASTSRARQARRPLPLDAVAEAPASLFKCSCVCAEFIKVVRADYTIETTQDKTREDVAPTGGSMCAIWFQFVSL